MPASLHDTAAFFRLTLALGWVEPRQIITWADDLLAYQDDPDPVLVDVALAGDASPAELGALLGVLSRGCHPALPVQMVFAYILREYHAGSFHAEHIIPTLYGLVRSEMIAVPYALEITIDDLQQALDDAGGDHDALDDLDADLITCLSWGDDAEHHLPHAYL